MKDQRRKLSIFTLLYQHSPKRFVVAVVVGAIAGALYSFIIPFSLRGLIQQKESTQVVPGGVGQATVFFGVCLSILIAKASSVIMVNNIAKSAVAELRIGIAEKVNRMMIANVETIGFSRFLTVLTDDVNNLSAAAVTIPMLLVSIVTVVGMLGYLATLDVTIFLIVLSAIIVGVLMFQTPVAMASGVYKKSRDLRDVIHEGLRGVVMGAYELKLNKHKSAIYSHEELVTPQQESTRLEKMGDAVLHIAGNASDLLAFFIIGIVVFVLPKYMDIVPAKGYGVVMALLYMAGPVAAIMGMMRFLNMGRVALQQINDLNDVEEDTIDPSSVEVLKSWTTFSSQVASYSYTPRSDFQDQAFCLMPVSLVFHRSQINFIVGGNGSGKSTLAKLLSLHYMPATGEIYFDNEKVNSKNIVQARSRISVVFSNYYLFGKLYREVTPADQQKIELYLDLLKLKGKTECINGCFTTTRLSDGQRRRLALLVALLEDRDIYVFDEWAADQDPEFKNIFYRSILQDMKRNNKLIIVITHDDRYFECADRIIFMEDGRVVAEKNIAPRKDLSSTPAESPLPMAAEAIGCE